MISAFLLIAVASLSHSSVDVPAVVSATPVSAAIAERVPGGGAVQIEMPLSFETTTGDRQSLQAAIEVRSFYGDLLVVDIQSDSPVVAQGTIDRGAGGSATLALAGAAQPKLWLTVQVPQAWRGDLLDVRVVTSAVVVDPLGRASRRTVDSTRLLTAVYLAGDAAAAQAGYAFAESQRKLLVDAAHFSPRIDFVNSPTPVHLVGRSLGIYEQPVPETWLHDWIFAGPYAKPNNKLPVDLRVSMLDYQTARDALEPFRGGQLSVVLAANQFNPS